MPKITPEIIWDGVSVWVNTSGNVGRFGRYGYDVHRTDVEQMSTGEVCLVCKTNTPFQKMTLDDWVSWQEALFRAYGITVPETAKPKWL